MRMPLELVNQNRVSYPREGAWLKPRCLYQRVDLNKVDRMTITLRLRLSGVTVAHGELATEKALEVYCHC